MMCATAGQEAFFDPMLPERFGRYEVLAEIGDGAMGRVYSAWDPGVSRVVAVKTIKAEYLTRDTADEYLKRFRREAQAAGGLNHPAIVRVFDLGDDLLVMELVEGRTLHGPDPGRGPPRAGGDPAAPRPRSRRPSTTPTGPASSTGTSSPPTSCPARRAAEAHGLRRGHDRRLGHDHGRPDPRLALLHVARSRSPGENVTSRSDVYSLAVVAYEMLDRAAALPGPDDHRRSSTA